MKKVLFCLVVLLASSFVSATEQEEAKALCIEATTLAENGAGPKGLGDTCEHIPRPPSYWQCVIKKMKQDNLDFTYSAQQCDKADPQ